jgi:hypothetical protein
VTATIQPGDQRVLLVRLPCNPDLPGWPGRTWPITCTSSSPPCRSRSSDLAAVPLLDVEAVLLERHRRLPPTLLAFSWRDIQIYAPVDGRGGNPLQNSFEVFYARNPLQAPAWGAFGGLRLMASFYGELWRNLRPGAPRPAHVPAVLSPRPWRVLGGGAVSVFYEQLGAGCRRGTVVSVGEGEPLAGEIDPRRIPGR